VKLVFACGGTGGHIFPAFSAAEEIKKRHPATEIIYVCGKKDIENAIFKLVSEERTVPIESAPYRGPLSLVKPAFLSKLFSGFSESARLIRREKPDIVVGFGGYVSFPAVLMARFLGVRTLLHEQNVVPGLSNKILKHFADGLALSYAEAAPNLRHRNSRVTGNPIRSAIEEDKRSEALAHFGFAADKTTILVLGGSQGAESINKFFIEALAHLSTAVRASIQVLHLCGRMAPEAAEKAYRENNVTAKAHSFFDRMDLAYGATDLAVGRAGATFLAEITAKRIPAILIPYPYGNGHQRDNARVFSKSREALVLEQADLTGEKLAAFLVEYLAKTAPGAPVERCRRAGEAGTNSRTLLADFIEEEISKK
jgi:UDP-N-acetylglucosamine--N-acetylmuramyl-(pentapeptide) pyrophosphoryl-undecaprenol N-acetylglucosamine transferase